MMADTVVGEANVCRAMDAMLGGSASLSLLGYSAIHLLSYYTPRTTLADDETREWSMRRGAVDAWDAHCVGCGLAGSIYRARLTIPSPNSTNRQRKRPWLPWRRFKRILTPPITPRPPHPIITSNPAAAATMSHVLFDDTFVVTSLNPHKKRFARGTWQTRSDC